jgi:hypothetical protein
MHPDVGVCSIGYDELKAVPLLRQQRGHAAQPRRACGMDDREQRAAHDGTLLLGQRKRARARRTVDDSPLRGPGSAARVGAMVRVLTQARAGDPTSSTRWVGVLLGSHKHDRGVLETVCLLRAAPDAAGLFA